MLHLGLVCIIAVVIWEAWEWLGALRIMGEIVLVLVALFCFLEGC